MKSTKASSTHDLSAIGAHSIRVAGYLSGIPVETLRIWERRYGFPKPVRQDTGRRLYSDEDVRRLQSVARAVQAGFRPGEVIGKSPEALARLVQANHDTVAPAAVPGPLLSDSAGLIRALVSGDVEGLQRQLRQRAEALGAKAFVTELAQPLAVKLGSLWAEGELAIHQEHLGSECLSTQLRILLAQFQGATPRPLILLANLPGEPHRLPLELVAVYLAASRATPHLLGLQTPPVELAAAAKALHANAVGLTVTAPPTDDGPKMLLRELRRLLPKKTTLWVGGAFASSVAPVGATVITSWAALDAALGAQASAQRATVTP